MTMLYECSVETKGRYANITQHVREAVEKSGVLQGLAVIQLPHTTAGIGITSFWDPRGIDDLFHELERNLPARLSYAQENAPLAAAARAKAALCGCSTALIIQNGKLLLGSSQGICLLEFDGPRTRKLRVQILERPVVLTEYSLMTEHLGTHEITARVQAAVSQSGVREGICHVSMPHSTAGLVVCGKSKLGEVSRCLELLSPTRSDYLHTETPWDAAGHVKTVFAGSQQSFAVANGALVLEGSLAIAFAEFDGPRSRKFYVGVSGKSNGTLSE